MNRIALRFLNAPIFILLAIIGVALQTSLFATYPFIYLQPDIIILGVIWCALRRDYLEGGIITLLFAEIAEIHSGSPAGSFLVTYMFIYLGIRFLARYFYFNNIFSMVGLTLFASVAFKISALLLTFAIEGQEVLWRHTIALLPVGALMNAILADWVFPGLERFDWITYKDQRALRVLPDEFYLEEEGL